MSHSEIHVVVAVIINEQGEILLTQRLPGKHLAGCWEFPGGKVEADESPIAALKRELSEELDIVLVDARPLISVAHSYPEKKVLLDVWQVSCYTGTPHGNEGQPLVWVPRTNLHQWALPPADDAIVAALKLPSYYLITPEPEKLDQFLTRLEKALLQGVRLVQLRANTLSSQDYYTTAVKVINLCQRYEAKVLLNASIEQALSISAGGVHLTSGRLHQLTSRPQQIKWLAASCHTAADIVHACKIGVDFIVLSPVKKTQSHPNAKPIGWSRFKSLVDQSAVPVYALGGLSPDDCEDAWQNGAQGIAAIRGLWVDQ